MFLVRSVIAVVVVTLLISESYGGNVFKFSQQATAAKNAPFSKQTKPVSASACGYKYCNLGNTDMINVHLVPHTHDDVGWLKTVDQYYYGARNDIQWAGVQYILDTVVQELLADRRKRFIYVEMAFFHRWWQQQHDSMQHTVRGLVNEGRLEFILGGWSMNDEASTHYSAIIDQHTLGFKFLDDVFGDCGHPKIGWQIDPFGHSREMASLFAQFAFDGLFFARLDYQDWNQRLKTKTLESVWMASESLGDQSSLFTGVLYNGYGPPSGFCFDAFCSDEPIRDDERLEGYNVKQVVDAFIATAKEQASHYSTSHIMMTMGSDFQYADAHMNFKNYDKLIDYVNAQQANGSRVNVLYSTPSCYLYAVNQVNHTYKVKTDDFFPYASDAHVFWTGYFTSRPALKGYVRSCNTFLQTCKQLEVLAQVETIHGSDLKVDVLRQAMGVAQHHDAVSGTEKQHVANDYAKQLAEGVTECQDVIEIAYNYLLPIDERKEYPDQIFCNLLNVSVCPITEGNSQFGITVFNPIAHNVSTFVRLPVSSLAFGCHSVVLPHLNQAIQSQVVPLMKRDQLDSLRKGSDAVAEIVFPVQLPPLGIAVYFVKKDQEFDDQLSCSRRWSDVSVPSNGDFTIKNEFLVLTFDGSTGLLKSVANLENSLTVSLSQTLQYYTSFAGNNSEGKFWSSGAYAFRPASDQPTDIASVVKTTLVVGNLVKEVHQDFGSWASQVIRLYEGEKQFEIEYTVGPIPIADGLGKEIISSFSSNIKSAATFYTDANGREVLKRVRNYRPTWSLNQTEQVSGNYYPVNSRIFIQDESAQLTVLTDRSQGGSSIRDGQLELMVHRRTLHDDSFGVGEPLNETGTDGRGLVVRGKHVVILDTPAASVARHRELAQQIFMQPSLSFFTGWDPTNFTTYFKTTWSGLQQALPPNVHLLTLEQWLGDDFLLRLEHFYGKGEDPVLSQPATVQLKKLFAQFKIESIIELTLGANQELQDAVRLQWNAQGKRTGSKLSDYVTPIDPNKLEVVLNPMQIRTFQVSISATVQKVTQVS